MTCPKHSPPTWLDLVARPQQEGEARRVRRRRSIPSTADLAQADGPVSVSERHLCAPWVLTGACRPCDAYVPWTLALAWTTGHRRESSADGRLAPVGVGHGVLGYVQSGPSRPQLAR